MEDSLLVEQTPVDKSPLISSVSATLAKRDLTDVRPFRSCAH
ncbi:hypothetical protein SynA1560_01638 [Synechococcus sp. A15-60]|nr:hypothetical protein SynA1560_01638 [Synechococcus sp. A15-60]